VTHPSAAGSRRPVLLRALVALPARVRTIAAIELARLDRLPGRRWSALLLTIAVAAWFALFRPEVAPARVIGYGEVWQPVLRDIYTESVPFMVLAVSLGLLGRTPGMLFVLAFGVLDFAYWIFIGTFASNWAGPRPDTIVGRLILDGLLWVLVVIIPGLQRRSHEFARRRVPAPLGGAALSAAATGVLVWAWTAPMPWLQRPAMGALVSGSPTYESVAGVQVHDLALAVAAGVVALAVALLLQRGPWFAIADRLPLLGESLARTPIIGHAVRYGVVLALLLGFMTTPIDLVIILAALVGADLIVLPLARRAHVALHLPGLPAWIGLGVGVLLSGLVSVVIFSMWWGPTAISEFLVIVVAIAVGLLVVPLGFGLLSDQATPSDRPSSGGAAAGGTALAVALAMGIAWVALPSSAAADNCSGFIDCVTTWGAKQSVMDAAIAAFIWGWLKGVFLHRLVGAVEPLASEEGAAAELGQLQSMQDAVAKEVLGQTGDTDEFSRIKGLSPAEFAQEAMTGKWDGLMSYGSGSSTSGGGLSVSGSGG
jgi:hypothetical protein